MNQRERSEVTEHRGVDRRTRAGEHVAAEVHDLSPRLGDDAARLAHEQPAGGDVPGGEARLEERLAPAGRHVRQVERRGAHPPNARHVAHDAGERLEVARVIPASAMRDARRDDRAPQIGLARDGEPAVAEPGTAPLLGPENLVLHHVEHGTGHDLPLHLERDGHGEVGDPVEEVRRPVERVGDEARRLPVAVAPLFEEQPIARVRGRERCAEDRLRAQVSAGDEVARPLLAHLDEVGAQEVLLQALAGAKRGAIIASSSADRLVTPRLIPCFPCFPGSSPRASPSAAPPSGEPPRAAMLPASPASDAARSFVRWTLRYGRAIWISALLLAVPATYRTVRLYTHLRSELEELLPRDAPSVRALDEMRARLPGLQFLGVVVEAGTAGDLPSAERFLDDLAARIRAYPPSLVKDVRTGNGDERAFIEKHAPLYIAKDDLAEVLRRIEARRDYEVAKESGTLLDEDAPPPSVDTSDIEKKYDTELAQDTGDHLTSAALKATMLFVEAGDFSTGAEKGRDLLDRVKADVAALDPGRYAPKLRVGYASDVAINVEELEGLQEDLSVSSVLVIFAVMAAIVLYYHWWKSIPVLIPPLLLATVYAFGLASLPPFHVTELNSNTAFLGSIIVGNGINVGLVLLARYREERLRGATVDEALVHGVWGARAGTLAAAAAASAAYASLVVTEFRGFRQFGIIGGIGMLTSWVTAFVLLPPLVKWLDHGPHRRAPRRRRSHGFPIMRWIVHVVENWAAVLVTLAAALAVLSVLAVTRFDASRLEYDFNKLRRADTWQNGEGYWGRKMDALLGHYITPTVVLCDTVAKARSVEAKIKESVAHGALEPFIARVVGADDILPQDQPAKIAIARKIRDALTPKIRSLVPEEKRAKLDKMLGEGKLVPIAARDLPRSFLRGLQEKDGTVGRTILLYPRPSDALWKADGIFRFVGTVRDLAAAGGSVSEAGRVAGSIPLTDDILGSIARDAPVASTVSFCGVVLVVVFVVRGWRPSLFVLGSLVLGVLWLCGATMALGIKINFANFIAFPITFGIGVDYAVNVIARYVQDGERDVTGAVKSTGGAVALCSMTTIIGYSSLLLAKNRALSLFGLLAVLGEVACLSAAILVLPSVLVLLRRRGA